MKIKRLVLGTNNIAKINEWKELLEEFIPGLEVVSVNKIGDFPGPKETGNTFKENARQKSTYFALASHEFVFSDDGGYEVDALNGAPGVRSRRILPGGKEGTDKELIDYVLDKLKGLPMEKRGVKLTSAAALSDPKGNIIFEDEESKEGIVAKKAGPVLIDGYPFRSIHFLPNLRKTYAELTKKEHRMLNHKRKIAKRLAEFIKTKY